LAGFDISASVFYKNNFWNMSSTQESGHYQVLPALAGLFLLFALLRFTAESTGQMFVHSNHWNLLSDIFILMFLTFVYHLMNFSNWDAVLDSITPDFWWFVTLIFKNLY